VSLNKSNITLNISPKMYEGMTFQFSTRWSVRETVSFNYINFFMFYIFMSCLLIHFQNLVIYIVF